MYGDIKLGHLNEDELQLFLSMIKQYVKRKQRVFIKKTEDDDYYLCVPCVIGSELDKNDKYIY